MESAIFLDAVIGEGEGSSMTILIFKLLSSKDKSLLIWWDTFLVLDLGLDIFNGVCWFDIEGDSFTCECFDENLHF